MNAEAGGQQLPDGIEQTVAEVETYLESNPKNGRGWELLAPVYLRLGRFDDAVRARRNALEIFGPDAARLGDLGEAIVMASNGVVTPEAKGLFERANAADPEDVMAQYYLGLSAKQEGRRDEALKRWTRWRRELPRARNGCRWSGMRSPDRREGRRPPSLRRSRRLRPRHRQSIMAAIEAMVERLAERLKKDGSDVPGWIQLVRSYRVLGKADKAKAADRRCACRAGERSGGPAAPGPGSSGARSRGAAGRIRACRGRTGRSANAAAPAGPNASQVAAAAQMAPAERNGMIEGMVARLAQRMAENGSDVDGWLRLIKAYSVLGERDKALAAAANARNALAGNSDNLRRIGELTKELGLEGS